ncbi:MAG: hypothetical protein WAN87_07255 [Thermoplasmata archaeon]
MSPPPAGAKAYELATGGVDLPAAYSIAEGDGSFPWNDSLGPVSFHFVWHTGFAASLCVVNVPAFVNYSTCQGLGGTASAYETSGQMTLGIVNATYALESYSFIEPPGYSDAAIGMIQVNYSSGSDESFSGQLAVLGSLPISTTWSVDAFPLPPSDDHFEFWFNVSLDPMSNLSVSGTDGAICTILPAAGLGAHFWACKGAYADGGRPTFQPEVMYTAVENATAYYDLWVW